jgi:hypothetical protein
MPGALKLDQSKLRRLQEPLELDHSRLKRLHDHGTENTSGKDEFEKQTLEQFMHRKNSKRPQRKRTQHLTLCSLNVNGTKALVDAAIGQECPSPKKKDHQVLAGAGRGRIVAFNTSQDNRFLKNPSDTRFLKNSGSKRATAAPPVFKPPTKTNDSQLRSSLCELESIIRVKIVDAGTMTRVKQEVVGALDFIQEIEKVAFEKNILKGKAFQELLASCGLNVGRLVRTPSAKVTGSVFNDPTATLKMAMQAKKLINLLRLKVEDDKDLDVAKGCLEGIRNFFANVHKRATATGVDDYTFFKNLERLHTPGAI